MLTVTGFMGMSSTMVIGEALSGKRLHKPVQDMYEGVGKAPGLPRRPADRTHLQP